MSSLLAQQIDDGRKIDPSIVDNEWLDEVTLHFGEWVSQTVNWTDQNLGPILDTIRWPFQFLFDLLMNEDPDRTAIMDIPWYWVAIGFFVIGSIARNTRVGLMVALMVATCGVLGPDYWSVTAKTFGMVAVSVFLCTIIGVPLGILCGRIDAVWNVVRPTLDAMQVVHSFVYMLPFIFFWGVGEVSATMVTMVFALPPIVRLTNLGIRQVPEDVVEASRSYGASEPRVLFDVQLPLARPAIMTGLNQTLLLSISMLGIAAIMGAASLGTLLLRAISSQNLPLAASGGLAFFLVAVVLDRISQREIDDGKNLLERMRDAWSYRSNPEELEGLVAHEAAQRAAVAEAKSEAKSEAEANAAAAAEAAAAAAAETAEPDERPVPVGSTERLGLMLGAIGGIGAVISVFLPWGSDAGLIAAWGRSADETELIGQSFTGIEASGGNVFGVLVLLFAFLAAMAALRPLFSFDDGLSIRLNQTQYVLFGALGAAVVLIWLFNLFGAGFGWLANIGLLIFAVAALLIGVDTWIRGTPRLGADGVVIASIGAFGTALGYAFTRTSPGTVEYSHGIGLYLALLFTAVAVVGGLIALASAPYTPFRPLSLSISWGSVVGAVFGIALLFVGCYAAWMIDERLDSLITPEIEAQITALEEEAGDDINKQIANAQEITNIINLARAGDAPHFFGFLDGADDPDSLRKGNGPRLGWPTFGFGLLAGLAVIASSGVFGREEGLVWRAGTLATGFGLASLGIPLAWILSFGRSAEPTALTAAGVFFAAAAAFVLFAVGRGSITEFRRRKIYADLTPTAAQMIDLDDAPDSDRVDDEALVSAT
ncbi:MAG: ABC transporter permease subunit [Actinomycetota bacterium]